MNIALWIVAIILAVVFGGSGLMKLTQPAAKLIENGLTFVETWPLWSVRAIGAAEVLAAIGLIVPWATGIAPVLTPLAAVGLVIVMLGAIVVHGRKGEMQMVAVNVGLGALALFVALGRF